jgi:hypothetical protein
MGDGNINLPQVIQQSGDVSRLQEVVQRSGEQQQMAFHAGTPGYWKAEILSRTPCGLATKRRRRRFVAGQGESPSAAVTSITDI